MFYSVLKTLVGIFFNILNVLLAGNLPPFGSVCVIVEEQGRYLFIEKAKGKFVLPSGFMRWREHPIQTAQREGKEETGLDLRIGDVVGYYTNISPRFDLMSTLTIAFAAEVAGGELRKSIEGQPVWLTEAELNVKLRPHYRKVIEDYIHHRQHRSQMKISNL